MLPNEVFALECLARYEREGLDVKKGGVHGGYQDEFAHCPYPKPVGQVGRLPGDLGYYLTFFDHQHQGLLQSVDVGRRCYWIAHVKEYLDTWPPGCFELWDIYDKFNKPTEETKKKLSVARPEEVKKRISETMTGRTGALCPMYGRTGAASNRGKAIIVIKPDGTKLHFGSIAEAARELEFESACLSRYLTNGKQPEWGKSKGYQFFYAVKE